MSVSHELVRYDAMCRAIDACYQVDEVKDIRDKARALQVYMRQAKNVEAERQACEIRLRAERKCGQLLKEMEKAKGTLKQGTTLPRSDHPTTATLSDLGLSKQQSSDFQKLADIPDEDFEAALATEERPTTNGIISAHASKPPTPSPQVDDDALWLCELLENWERERLLMREPRDILVATMTSHMRATIMRLAPLVSDWLRRISSD